MYNKILVPLDGSNLSEEVLPLVRTLAEMSKGQVILLRVAEFPYSLYPPCYEYPPSDPDAVDAIAKEKSAISREVSAYLERIASTLREAGIAVSTEICDGPVVDSILACADRLGANLVVLSAYGQSSGMQGTIGATASRVLHEAQVAVILVRPIAPSFVQGPNGGTAKFSQRDLAESNHFIAGADKNRLKTSSRRTDMNSDRLPRGA